MRRIGCQDLPIKRCGGIELSLPVGLQGAVTDMGAIYIESIPKVKAVAAVAAWLLLRL
jgi:hypothetical protein